MNKFFKDRGFGQKIGYGDRPSLIVIDLVQGFTDPEKPLGADLSAQLAETRRLLDAARRAKIPVYYTPSPMRKGISATLASGPRRWAAS